MSRRGTRHSRDLNTLYARVGKPLGSVLYGPCVRVSMREFEGKARASACGLLLERERRQEEKEGWVEDRRDGDMQQVGFFSQL